MRRVKGSKQLIAKINQLRKDQPKVNERILKTFLALHNKNAKKLTPVDTGNLRNNWFMEVKQGDYISYNNVEYAPFQELGFKLKNGRFVHGKFMNKIAFDIVRMNESRIIKREYNKSFKK